MRRPPQPALSQAFRNNGRRLALHESMLKPLALLLLIASGAIAETRTANFDQDPQWEGLRNQFDASRSKKKSGIGVDQDFGYSATNFAGA